MPHWCIHTDQVRFSTAGEELEMWSSVAQAAEARDALAKAIYELVRILYTLSKYSI